MIHILADILFPSKCVSCENPVSIRDRGLCDPCGEKIVKLRDKCPRCSGDISEGECGICSGREFYPARNISIAEYSGMIKEMIINIKFKKRQRLAPRLAELGLIELSENYIDFDILTFVPMNRNKKWKRGFNQSELLSRYLSKRLKKPVHKLLSENYISITQKDLGYRERFINVLNRYKVINRKSAMGKKILIVDDVFTTGATINECARVLLNSGADKVFSLTIARASVKKA